MVMLIVSMVFVSINCVLAFRANSRFRHEDQLPMQWGLSGEVNWFAPRRLALASMPMLAFAVLGFQTILSTNVAPRPGQEGLVFPVLVATGATLVAVQLLHFWLIEKTVGGSAE
ncbi:MULTISPECIES: hypothetical protein [unclassified Sphingomonas]|uniref:hypothetical protein n=1 Tax=unclassified Sphingomonas TaxID=196159 RepID=UPI002269DF14|nr:MULTISPECIES: hypothetical protein [unclassified Sphingomonas]